MRPRIIAAAAGTVLVVVFAWAPEAVLAQASPDPPTVAAGSGEAVRAFLGLGPPPDAAAAKRGAPVYAANCAFCHGPLARGAEGPSLI